MEEKPATTRTEILARLAARKAAKPIDPEAERKQACRNETHRLIRQGEIIPQPCEECTEPKAEAHHLKNYTDPRALRWLCERCHTPEHQLLNLLRKGTPYLENL